MSTRFKFRVWDKRTNIMHYGAEKTYDFMHGNPIICAACFGDLLDDDNYIIEQCTGLKDKNGKLIYAHDVVRTVTGCVGVVEWIPERCGFAVHFPDDTDCVVHETQEIIGNIHEMEVTK